MTCRATPNGYLTAEHYDGCDNPACRGCFPCVPASPNGDPLDHCTARARCSEHVEPGVLSCPRCVGKVRATIRRIRDLTALLPVASVESGSIDSEAFNLAGPAADPAGWSNAVLAERRAIFERYADDDEAAWAAIKALPDDDPAHPYRVLGRWQMMLEDDPRECYPVDARRITVNGAADYLERNLGAFAQDDEQDFPLFMAEASGCLVRVETALSVAVRGEVGAPCPACAVAGEDAPPRLKLHRVDSDLSGASDKWRCPIDRDHVWTEGEYRKWVSEDYLANSDRLTAPQMRAQYRVPEGSVRGWASKTAEDGKALVRKRGKDGSGRQLYDVADVVGVRDGTRRATLDIPVDRVS